MDYFQRTDPWIFLAIARETEGEWVSLEDLIRVADYINHAIPSHEEIEGAVNRFLAAGLVNIDVDKFCLTSAGAALYRRVREKSNNMLKQWEIMAEYIKEIEFEKVDVAWWKLDPDEKEKAYQQYSKKFWGKTRGVENREE